MDWLDYWDVDKSASCLLSICLGGSIPTSRPRRSLRSPRKLRTPVKRPTQKAAGGAYVGCSGWAYPSWKPGFYPASVSSKKFLEHYATRLNSVEVNYTFRSLPSRATVDGWLAQTGDGFRFSFKAPQRITHIRRLKECGPALAEFAEAIGPVAEAGRMGLVLVQLAPNMKADTERLEAFLADAKPLGLRLAFEFRHASWFDAATYRLLEAHTAALCVAESDELETPDVATAPFACYRLRKSEYTKARLREIAELLTRRAECGEVFAYFKHEDQPTGALRAAAVLEQMRGRAA